MRKTIAIDIGASSGRLVKGTFENNQLSLEEVYRFENTLKEKNGHLVWDYDYILTEIEKGLKAAGKVDSIAIDTWGVDFVLLDEDGKLLGDTVSYRDSRTDNIKCPITQEELYSRTGIQYLKFNTIYQLLYLKEADPQLLEKARYLLMVPDYLSYKLTGKAEMEYTNASTTNLIDVKEHDWDFALLEELGLKKELFTSLKEPGAIIGPLKKEYAERIGYEAVVVHAPSHDTAAAVAAMPLDEESCFISSGTWSLVGTELNQAILTDESREHNFSNEGGVNKTIRYLKNIMGLWLIQCLRKETGLSFNSIEAEAAKHLDVKARIDAEDIRFLSPSSMKEEILAYLKETGQQAFQSDGELFAIVYHSLTDGYKKAIDDISRITGRIFRKLVLVGGGTKDKTLIKLTEEKLGLKIVFGPQEGSACGNIFSQLIALNEIDSFQKARKIEIQ